MKKVIFWDFDGTLSTPNRLFSTALYDAALELNIRLDQAAATDFLANAYTWKTPFENHSSKIGEKWWLSLFDKINTFLKTQGVEQEYFEIINQRTRELLMDVNNYSLYTDTVYALETCLRRGYNNCLLTNNYPEIVDNLKNLGIARFFEEYVVSSHIGYDKPRRELFEYAKALFGIPDICYMIGDNPIADIRGAKQANIKAIYVRNGYCEEADYCFDNLLDVLEIIE